MKRVTIYIIYILAVCLTLLSTGCGKEETNTQLPPVRVEIANAKPADYQMQISYSGTIEESVSITLSFPLAGTVDRVTANEGQPVRKGELLATVNSESYKNAYELSLAKQKQAEDAYKRFEPMFKNSSVPEIKIIEIRTGLQQSIASTAIAKKNWDDCKLIAPANGVIGKRSIEPGMNVLPNVPVFNLIQIEKVFVRFPVPENEVARIKKGEQAEIEIPALGKERLTGKIEEIGVIANSLSRSYDVKIGLPNQSGIIRPGMVCNVFIITGEKASAVVVPNQAVLVDENGDNFVYVADGKQNKALKRKVTVGPLLKEGICITSGLELNESVIVSGTQKLTDDSSIITVH